MHEIGEDSNSSWNMHSNEYTRQHKVNRGHKHIHDTQMKCTTKGCGKELEDRKQREREREKQ